VRPAIHLLSAALSLAALTLGLGDGAAVAGGSDPAADARAFRNYFTSKFPRLRLEDFVNGPYSMNEDMHRQWVEKEEFPPYDFSLDQGKEMFAMPFKNGKSYAIAFQTGVSAFARPIPISTRRKPRSSPSNSR